MLTRKSLVLSLAFSLAILGAQPATWAYNNPAFNRGKDAMATGDWDGAVAAFGEALGMNPTDPDALSMRGACFYKLGNYKLAIEDLNNSLEYAPNNLRGLLLRGTCHAQLGHDAMAIIDYEQAIRMDPNLAKKFFAAQKNNSPALNQNAALSTSLTGNPANGSEDLNLYAVQDYKDAMNNVYPNGYVDMDNAGNDSISRGQQDRARARATGNALAAAAPNSGNAGSKSSSGAGADDTGSGSVSRSERDGNKVFKGDYGNPAGNSTFIPNAGPGQVGATQAIAPPGKAGTGMVDNTAGMPAINSDAANNSSLESSDTINPNKDKRLVRSLDQDPNRSEIGPLAGAGVMPGDPHKAVIDYTQALGLDPTNAEYYFRRAKAYQKMNKVNEAMGDFEHAISQDPNNARYYIGRASLFYQLGKTVLLQADIESARNCDPDLPTKIHFYVPPLPKDATWAGDGAN